MGGQRSTVSLSGRIFLHSLYTGLVCSSFYFIIHHRQNSDKEWMYFKSSFIKNYHKDNDEKESDAADAQSYFFFSPFPWRSCPPHVFPASWLLSYPSWWSLSAGILSTMVLTGWDPTHYLVCGLSVLADLLVHCCIGQNVVHHDSIILDNPLVDMIQAIVHSYHSSQT